jgi:hypothetical protein
VLQAGCTFPSKGPKLEQIKIPCGAVAAQNGHLPLTAAYVAGFINWCGRGMMRWQAMQT